MITWTLNPCSRVRLPDSPPVSLLTCSQGTKVMMMNDKQQATAVKNRFYRKRIGLFTIVNKIKLWPSRSGSLHGIRLIEVNGNTAKLTTHCNKEFHITNSLNSRAGRWLRNRWYSHECAECRIPVWKIEKYSTTRFRRHQGSLLLAADPERAHRLQPRNK